MNTINIAELLCNCPKGMKLYSPLVGECKFVKVHDYGARIIVESETGATVSFQTDGRYYDYPNAECLLYPAKGKTTWEGFVPPCKFKDGDVIFTHANCLKVGLGNTWISIFQEKRNGGVATYVDMREDGEDYYDYIGSKGLLCMDKDIMRQRFATEEEKAKLFQAIKDNGYKWNAETKILEKLPKFNVGDRVRNKNYKDYIYDIHDITDKGYRAKEIDADSPIIILFGSEEDNYELVPNKFDINTLKPYDKVLYRMHDKDTWCNSFYSFYKSNHHFVTSLTIVKQCIPYEGNQHLLGTTDDCDEFYKTWE